MSCCTEPCELVLWRALLALESQACSTPISRPHSPPPDHHWTSSSIDLIDDMHPPPSATIARMPSACLASLGSYRIPDALRLSPEQYVCVIGCLLVWGSIGVPWLERVWTSSRAGGSGGGWGFDGGGRVRVRAVQRQPGREDELRCHSRIVGKILSATVWART
jgi:hypothetical protein